MTATPETTPRTQAATSARKAMTEDMLARVQHALKQLRRERATISVAAIARRAGVSRTFLYQNQNARQLVAAHTPTTHSSTATPEPEHTQPMWRERALNAEAQHKHAMDEIGIGRLRIGELLGRIRELEADLPADGVHRLLTENRTLREDVTQLTQDNRRLTERLTGARENNRFLDKRIAELEAQLLEATPELPSTALPARQRQLHETAHGAPPSRAPRVSPTERST